MKKAIKQGEEERRGLDKKWEKLNAQLKISQGGYREPEVPFKKEKLVKEFNEMYGRVYDKERFLNQ